MLIIIVKKPGNKHLLNVICAQLPAYNTMLLKAEISRAGNLIGPLTLAQNPPSSTKYTQCLGMKWGRFATVESAQIGRMSNS